MLAVVGWLVVAGLSSACPFCNAEAGKTVLEELREARVVVCCTVLSNDDLKLTTDLRVETTIKDDKKEFPKGKRLTISRSIDKTILGDKKMLLFCDVYKGKVDAYRGMVEEKSDVLTKYAAGMWARKDKSIGDRLRFCFDYLDSKDSEASSDAYKEFARADYADYKDMAKTLPSDRILKWLDPKNSDKTVSYRFGLYASMLGHCGKKEDAKKVKKILDDPDRRSTGVDGLLAAFVMLSPKEGFEYIRGILNRPKEDFLYRYAALRAVRFLHDYRQDLIPKKELVGAAMILLAQDDISDMAIEDLRKWKSWDVADKVLAVSKRESFDETTVIKRAVLRYCLQCQGSDAAKAYVAARRKEDAEAVKDAEELLELEKATATPAVKPKK
jgi:hypothetical protein